MPTDTPLDARRLFIPFSALPSNGAPLSPESLLQTPFVPGVSVMTVGQAEGHSIFDDATNAYLPEWVDDKTLQSVVAVASQSASVRSKDGHWGGLNDTLGFLRSFRVDGLQVRADLTLYKTHAQFAHTCNLIGTVADTFGMSIDCARDHEIIDGKAFIRVTRLYSCDLVDAPAANKALFDNAPKPKSMPENATPPAPATPPAAPAAAPDTAAITAAVDAAIAPLKTDLATLTTKVNDLAAKVEAAPGGTPAPTDPPATPAMEALRADLNALQKKLDVAFSAKPGATPAGTPATDENADSPRAALLAKFRAETDPVKRAALAAQMRTLK
jgi:hypothetical protein